MDHKNQNSSLSFEKDPKLNQQFDQRYRNIHDIILIPKKNIQNIKATEFLSPQYQKNEKATAQLSPINQFQKTFFNFNMNQTFCNPVINNSLKKSKYTAKQRDFRNDVYIPSS